MERNLELKIFPEGIEGHPACIAYLIMMLYPDFQSAVERPEGATYCKALCDQRIPGGGSDVWAALDCLKRGQHLGVDGAFAAAQAYWDSRADLSAARRAKGNAQAKAVRESFGETLAQWGAVLA
jgi:hypothetical protein